MRLREELVEIYRAAVRSLSGETLVREALAGMQRPERLQVLALGKAAGAMLRGMRTAWGDVPGVAVGFGPAEPGVEWLRSEHPVPGALALAAGTRLLAFVRTLAPEDTLLVLLSGGGSAMAEVPADGLTLGHLRATTQALLAADVPIDRINAVRKHLSQIKGGRLGAACGAGRTLVLAVSDVPGDDPAVIASGPFAADPSTFADALAIAHGLPVPEAVRAHLEAAKDETPKPGDPRLARIEQHILAGPLDLARRAAAIARERGFAAQAFPDFVSGPVERVAERWETWFASAPPPGSLLAAAAEPTVALPAEKYEGGRSQHLALRMSRGLRFLETDIAFLAAGSDGHDGVSRQAGAAVDGTTWHGGLEEVLRDFASGEAVRDLGVDIPEWDTGTNLADLHLLAIGR